MKKKVILGLAALIVLALAIFLRNSSTDSPKWTLLADGKTIQLEIADSEATRRQGLSDRTSLPENSGMLFIFPTKSFEGFWMKDMHFPLDMVWLDENFRVVTIAENISPETYPKVFYPTEKALYVLEINAGLARQLKIVPNSILQIEKK